MIKRVPSLVRLDKIETSFAMLSAPNQRACAQLDELRQAEKARMEKLLFVRLVKKTLPACTKQSLLRREISGGQTTVQHMGNPLNVHFAACFQLETQESKVAVPGFQDQ